MSQRMNIFWAKYKNETPPWSDDPILNQHKFTNVYRSTDRISQYLIRNVIYTPTQYDDQNTLFRILIFKVFNRIDTWEFIESKIGEISIENFKIDYIVRILEDRIKNRPIFNSAYLMTGSHNEFKQYRSKHERWLQMIDREFIKGELFSKIIDSNSLEDVFLLLSSCPFIGNFLAYQYAIDFNYSKTINFDENSFVKAGIGAIRGIKKCFVEFDDYTYEDVIKYTKDNLHFFLKQYDYHFENLFGREPTLIDIQNCFCETDKYLRVKMPDLIVDNIRIKQKYKNGHSDSIQYYFPPKWGINEKIDKKCMHSSFRVLTLF